MYDTILFDLDGTLSDSQEGIFKSVGYAMEKMGRPLPEETILKRFIGPPLQDSFCRECGFTQQEAREAVELFRQRYNTVGMYENRAVPGGVELLRRLKAGGWTLALASSKPQILCDPLVKHFGYEEFLTVVAGSDAEADEEKADVIRKAMKHLGLGQGDCGRILMVGDRKYDVLGAKACGIDCVGIELCGYAEEGELREAGAVAVVATMEELGRFLEEDRRTHSAT